MTILLNDLTPRQIKLLLFLLRLFRIPARGKIGDNQLINGIEYEDKDGSLRKVSG